MSPFEDFAECDGYDGPRCELCSAALVFIRPRTVYLDNGRVVMLVCEDCARSIPVRPDTGELP